MPFGDLGLRGRSSAYLSPKLFQTPQALSESRTAFPKALGDVVRGRRQVFFVKEVAIQPQTRLLRASGPQAQFVHLGQLVVVDRVDFEQLAVRQNSQVLVRMLLVADIAGKFLLPYRPALVVQSLLALKDEVAIEGVREAATDPHGRNVFFEKYRFRLFQPRKGCPQEGQEGVPD